jgi:hypothetical protein
MFQVPKEEVLRWFDEGPREVVGHQREMDIQLWLHHSPSWNDQQWMDTEHLPQVSHR